jgi:hypothetical protein
MSKKRELFIEVVIYAYMRGERYAAAHNFAFVDMTETLQPVGMYEHVWMRFDASSITQVHALQSFYEAFPLFCYSIQSTGNVENNARIVLWEQSIKMEGEKREAKKRDRESERGPVRAAGLWKGGRHSSFT